MVSSRQLVSEVESSNLSLGAPSSPFPVCSVHLPGVSEVVTLLTDITWGAHSL